MNVRKLGAASTVLVALAIANASHYSCEWWTLDAGGGVSSGGPFVLSGTIGQVDAGPSAGGEFVLSGGFWTASINTCPVDLTADGLVDGADLSIVLGNWLTAGPGDLNGSGSVDGADLAIVLGGWGPCP